MIGHVGDSPHLDIGDLGKACGPCSASTLPCNCQRVGPVMKLTGSNRVHDTLIATGDLAKVYLEGRLPYFSRLTECGNVSSRTIEPGKQSPRRTVVEVVLDSGRTNYYVSHTHGLG